MALSALKRKAEQFLGWNEAGNDDGQQSGERGGEQCGERGGFQGGNECGQPSEDEVEAYVVGDRLVLGPPGQKPAPDAHDHAVQLLAWLTEKCPVQPRELWVASRDLER